MSCATVPALAPADRRTTYRAERRRAWEPMGMKRPRLMLAFAVLAVIAIASAVYFYSRGAATPPPTPGATQTGQALIGGPFALTDHTGRRVTEQDFRGRFMLVYFGYTHCPDMCPLGLETITQALDAMPPALAERVQPIFITVDPERDTQAVLQAYMGGFHPRLLGLTGGPEEVAAAARAYRVYAQKQPAGPGGDYLMDHSIFTYVMGPDGLYRAHFSKDTSPAAMAERLAGLVGEAPATS